MKGIRVDPHARRAQVQPGCTWGDVDHATHAFGLATVSGIISTTGVPGLTLGGGHGYLTRKYGLTVDNLRGADVVLADGSLVRASEDENPDLFWALRGGGGNFGIVTSFDFELHPVHTVQAGPTFWSLDDTETVLDWYRDFLPNAPEDLYGFFALHAVPPAPPFPEQLHERTVCSIMWCWSGTDDDAEAASALRRDLPEPLFEHIGPMPYPMLQAMFDRFYPPGLRWHWKGDFVRQIPDEAVAKHRAHAEDLPTPLSIMHLYPIDGAVHRVAQKATAFAYRDCNWSMVIAGVGTEPGEDDRIRDWARGYWDDLHPHSAGGAYVNFMEDEGDARVRAAYRGNYDRLVEIKTRCDPDNLFRRNQNIPPRR
jgi:FAD/FMN-containing dehydrogenase